MSEESNNINNNHDEEIKLLREGQNEMRKNMVNMMQLLEAMSQEKQKQQTSTESSSVSSDKSETSREQPAPENQTNNQPAPPATLANAPTLTTSNNNVTFNQPRYNNRRQSQVIVPTDGRRSFPIETTPFPEKRNEMASQWTSMLGEIGAQEEESRSSDEEYEGYARMKNRRKSLDNSRDRRTNRTSYLSNLGDRSQLRPRETIMYQAQPDYTHIQLKVLSIKAVHKFMREVATYQRMYNIELQVATLISHTVVKLLISASDWETLNESNFYSLQPKTIYRLMREYLQPTDQLTFYEKLDQNTKFYYEQDNKPSPSNFQKFYESILLYKQSFLEIFEFLSEKNEDNVPEISNRRNGIIKLFLDKIPEDFGQRLYTKIGVKNFESFQEFIQCFTDQVREVYRVFTKDKEASMLFNSNKAETFKQSEYSTPSKNGKSNYELKSTYTEPKEFQQHTNLEETTVQEERRTKNSDSEEAVIPLAQENELCAVTQEERGPNGCFRMIMTGACSRNNCSFTHDADALTKTIQYYEKKFQESKFHPDRNVPNSSSYAPSNGNYSRTVSAQPTTVPTMLPRRTGPHNKSYIQELDDKRNSTSESNFGALQEGTCALTEINMTTMHREGFIELPALNLPIARALFDTGALQADYISTSFVDEHKNLLEEKIFKSKSTVILGDNSTAIKTKKKVTLDIFFVDGSGKEHRATIKPCILDMAGNDLVIGLPTIACNFSQLFKDMLDTATETLSKTNLSTAVEFKPPWTSLTNMEKARTKFSKPKSHVYGNLIPFDPLLYDMKIAKRNMVNINEYNKGVVLPGDSTDINGKSLVMYPMILANLLH